MRRRDDDAALDTLAELRYEATTLRATVDALQSRLAAADDLLAGLLDGLDANGDGRDGLSSEEWDERVAKARAHLTPAPPRPEGGEVAR